MHFVFVSCMIFIVNRDYFLKQRYQIDLCNGECSVFFEVRIEFLTVISTSFGFRGLK
jgi:hypothetical protein